MSIVYLEVWHLCIIVETILDSNDIFLTFSNDVLLYYINYTLRRYYYFL